MNQDLEAMIFFAKDFPRHWVGRERQSNACPFQGRLDTCLGITARFLYRSSSVRPPLPIRAIRGHFENSEASLPPAHP